jgi:hypothetical protein
MAFDLGERKLYARKNNSPDALPNSGSGRSTFDSGGDGTCHNSGAVSRATDTAFDSFGS